VQQVFAKRICSAHAKVAAAVAVFENADGKQSGLFSGKTLPRGVFIAVLCVLETTLDRGIIWGSVSQLMFGTGR